MVVTNGVLQQPQTLRRVDSPPAPCLLRKEGEKNEKSFFTLFPPTAERGSASVAVPG